MLDALFSGNAIWFSVPALLGSGFFLLRVAMLVVGLGDSGGDGGDGAHADSGDAFTLVSLQAVAAFLMGFGWAGLVALQATAWPMLGVVGAGLAGGAAVWLVQALLLRTMLRMQTSGNISIAQAMGVTGTVYVAVPQAGRGSGQVRLVVDGRQRMFAAVSDGAELPSQMRVKVVKVNDDNTVVVTPAG